jgi:hypothetical protein
MTRESRRPEAGSVSGREIAPCCDEPRGDWCRRGRSRIARGAGGCLRRPFRPDSPVVDGPRLETADRRAANEAAEWIRSVFRVGVIEVWQEVIDRVNILEATRLAMRAGVRSLAGPEIEAVVDHVELSAIWGCRSHSFKACRFELFLGGGGVDSRQGSPRPKSCPTGDRRRSLGVVSKNKGYGTPRTAGRSVVMAAATCIVRAFRVTPVLP